jgi:hypothetical protein
MTKLTWLVDELQDEIETLDTSRYAQIYWTLALNLTDAIIRRTVLLRRAVAATHKCTNSLSRSWHSYWGGSDEEQNVTNTASWR